MSTYQEATTGPQAEEPTAPLPDLQLEDSDMEDSDMEADSTTTPHDPSTSSVQVLHVTSTEDHSEDSSSSDDDDDLWDDDAFAEEMAFSEGSVMWQYFPDPMTATTTCNPFLFFPYFFPYFTHPLSFPSSEYTFCLVGVHETLRGWGSVYLPLSFPPLK
ncbi:uncharacterized protein isoform X3 [Leptinotarsa decemlineata]|uniref:uncharacterized protein isoform X3 n=1 Tax=Leptinotarsa decemlineata TaxID=7539 RepID=UPI003D30AA79